MKKYLMSQYGMYIKKISVKKNWLSVELLSGMDKETYCKVQQEVLKTCKTIWDFPNCICVG
jgi:hypothetical protein